MATIESMISRVSCPDCQAGWLAGLVRDRTSDSLTCAAYSRHGFYNGMYTQRFNGQHGQAYLFDAVFNVVEANPEDRQMTTGLHRVRDISCKKCGQVMGWKYVS